MSKPARTCIAKTRSHHNCAKRHHLRIAGVGGRSIGLCVQQIEDGHSKCVGVFATASASRFSLGSHITDGPTALMGNPQQPYGREDDPTAAALTALMASWPHGYGNVTVLMA